MVTEVIPSDDSIRIGLGEFESESGIVSLATDRSPLNDSATIALVQFSPFQKALISTKQAAWSNKIEARVPSDRPASERDATIAFAAFGFTPIVMMGWASIQWRVL